MTYQEYKEINPVMKDCFFAFSNQQMAEGIKEHNLEGVEIFSADYGLYGTKEGIKEFLGHYDKISEEIKNNCNPQDVYNYECDNHEVSFTNDDSEVIDIIIDYFGIDKAKEIKRKYNCAYKEIV